MHVHGHKQTDSDILQGAPAIDDLIGVPMAGMQPQLINDL